MEGLGMRRGFRRRSEGEVEVESLKSKVKKSSDMVRYDLWTWARCRTYMGLRPL